jgi:hypothetical protein
MNISNKLIKFWQYWPAKPDGQIQPFCEQTPPLKHGFWAQAFKGEEVVAMFENKFENCIVIFLTIKITC